MSGVTISIVTEVSRYQIEGVRGHRTGYRQLKRLEKKIMNLRVARKKIKEVVVEEEEEEEDQGTAIDSDNSSELSEILSFEIDGIDGMDVDSISNGEGSGGEVLKTRSGRAFGI